MVNDASAPEVKESFGMQVVRPMSGQVLKKCKKPDDVLFINAAEHFLKDKRQNKLGDGENGTPDHIGKIVDTYYRFLQA